MKHENKLEPPFIPLSFSQLQSDIKMHENESGTLTVEFPGDIKPLLVPVQPVDIESPFNIIFVSNTDVSYGKINLPIDARNASYINFDAFDTETFPDTFIPQLHSTIVELKEAIPTLETEQVVFSVSEQSITVLPQYNNI